MVFLYTDTSRFNRCLLVWISLHAVSIDLIALMMRFGLTLCWAAALVLLPVVAASCALQRIYGFLF
jgi:hypothetical protein